ncbi:uncharacterized protein TRAVEDRAFT_66669 [Trametes versicolor FP-101664 SS1]|uniref:uncharacterized protein n=1 Tax=Trametes versicolor (strain FP-101664) TaxID=717944 RepID=UPI000462481E|nr:uncharacterized protein TRAVEDRAFT_66669 [Trametes versicolor FP-101664 SS1]EIW54016.1 hypothetical protein TRAVEDRAFT_66669 [Trametes versicolor FP-101664 SS1]
MAAARPRLAVVPSQGAGRAWGTVDSAPSASSSFLDLRSSSVGPSAPAGQGSATAAAKGKAPAVPQPNVKKMRRRVALLSGVHLNLPSSPVVGPSPPGSSREMAWTFTAEWDSTQDEIVFSEVENGSSAPSSTSSSSLRFIASPIPFDVEVEEDEAFDLDVPGAPPAAPSPPFSDMHASSSSSCSSPSSPSALSSPFSPSMSAVSEIFDFYMHTPHTLSFSHHDRNGSVSTAPSSPVGPPSPAEQSPPPYPASRAEQPVISVTFYQESENPTRETTAQVESAARAMFNEYSIEAATFTEKKKPQLRALPPAPSARHVARRPLPPVPTRGTSMPDVSAGAQQSSVWDDRVSRMPPRRLQSRQRFVPSAYSPPLAGPLHARAASLGNEATGRDAVGTQKGAVLGRHIRSISAALSVGLHRSH